jgi:DNA-binding transcriptional LysR family regulator
MIKAMLDLDLLHSFVSVIDSGGFTRAWERVHRTQSTVSQQIRRLEDSIGRPLLHRDGKRVTPTDEGERLLSYARRILSLAHEARDVVSRPTSDGTVRLGVSEDFAAQHLTEMLSDFSRSHPGLRLDVRCGLSAHLRRDLERDELDVALIKRDLGESGAIAAWRERLRWVTSSRQPIDFLCDPLPLGVFEQGCVYRERAIHTLESGGRAWRIAYMSPSILGIQAAVSAGLGVSILPEAALLPGHLVLGAKDRFPLVSDTEMALVTAQDPTPATRRLVEALTEFCNSVAPRARTRRGNVGTLRQRPSRAAAAKSSH